MVLLGISITIAILITIGVPIGVGFWLNKKYKVPWQIFSYSVMGYLLMQSVVSLILAGVGALVKKRFIDPVRNGVEHAPAGIEYYSGCRFRRSASIGYRQILPGKAGNE